MNIVPIEIMNYAEQHSTDEPELLAQLRRETWLKVLNPRMLSGHLQGRLLAMISKLHKPKTILEIGTYTGYATLCLAEGLASNGILYTIDQNEELVDIQTKYFHKSSFGTQIFPFLGNALNIIPTLNITFDLIFIDADKENYSRYFDLVIDKLNFGGIILTDNVLWDGKVLEKAEDKDSDTLSISRYNQKIINDKRVETVLIPFRDGISISRKIQ